MDRISFLLDKSQAAQLEYDRLDELLLAPEVTADIEDVKRYSMLKAKLAPIVLYRQTLLSCIKVQQECINELKSIKDGELRILAEDMLKEAESDISSAALSLAACLYSKPEDIQPITICVTPSCAEAGAFAEAIAKAYHAFCSKHRLNLSPIKNLTFNAEGLGAYSLLSTACCIHKLVGEGKAMVAYVKVYRVFAPVYPVLDAKNIRTDIFLSHGKGGQNINKVETAVRLTYLPTGLQITCQDERSQLKNKELALARLKERLSAIEDGRIFELNLSEKNNAEVQALTCVRTFDCRRNLVSDSRIPVTIKYTDALEGNIEPLFEALLFDNKL